MTGLTLLIDTSSLAYRAFFSVPETVTSPGGDPVNAVYGLFSMLAQLISRHKPDRLACCIDVDWRPAWRVDLIPSYKAHRAAPGSPNLDTDERIRPQLELAYALLDGCGVCLAGLEGYEAEDIIGTLSARTPGQVAIVSGDRDLFQLVEDPRVWVLYPRHGVSNMVRVDEAYIEARYAIPGRRYRDFAVLRGDSSDGLPGVRGIGDKTAAALIGKHGGLERILEAAAGATSGPLALIRSAEDYVRRAVKVVTIPADLPLPELDLRIEAGQVQPGLGEAGEANGLANPMRRLLSALRE